MDHPTTPVTISGNHGQTIVGHFRSTFTSIVTVLLLLCTLAKGQDQLPATRTSTFNVSLSLGFNTFALGDVRNFYNGLLEIYRTNGIPIPTQREFPGNLLVGVSLLYSIPSVADIGLGSRYTWTRAFSSYDDYAGSADVNSKISMVTLEGIIQKEIAPESIVETYAGVRGGLVFGRTEFSQRIAFNDQPDQNIDILLSGTGKGYSVEGFIGVKRRLSNVVLGVCTGYRHSKVSDMGADISLNGQPQGSGTLQIEHNLSGFVLSAHVDFVLE